MVVLLLYSNWIELTHSSSCADCYQLSRQDQFSDLNWKTVDHQKFGKFFGKYPWERPSRIKAHDCRLKFFVKKRLPTALFPYEFWKTSILQNICEKLCLTRTEILNKNNLNVQSEQQINHYYHCVKVSVFEVFLVRSFPCSDWIRRDTLSVISPNAGNQTNSEYGEFSRSVYSKCIKR